MKDLKNELINWKGRKILMVIYPHPDDETMASGGLLLAAKKAGWKTIVVILTNGSAGKNHLKKGILQEIRMDELKTAVNILGVDELIVGKFDDGKLREQQRSWEKWLNDQISKYNPGWLVTYDHSGISGHPDHISLSVALRNTNAKLWWSTVPKDFRLLNHLVKDYVSGPTHQLYMGWNWTKKYLAAATHKSQALGKGLPIPLWLALFLYRTEWYHEVEAKTDYKYKFVPFEI
jgi:LmbE family N-acetylglucosaminyl deacetylase